MTSERIRELDPAPEVRLLLVTQVAFLSPFSLWDTPELDPVRSGIAGVNFANAQEGKWSQDDLVRWSAFLVDPNRTGAVGRHSRIIGLDVAPEDLEGADAALGKLFGLWGSGTLVWMWYWAGPFLRWTPVRRLFHFRHPICTILLVALGLAGGVALVAFGHVMAQEWIRALATVIFLGVPLLIGIILVTFIHHLSRIRSAGKALVKTLRTRVLCAVCGRRVGVHTTPDGFSYGSPFGLSAVVAVVAQTIKTEPQVRGALWGDLLPAILDRLQTTGATGELQESGKINEVGRLADKLQVAAACKVEHFLAPRRPKAPHLVAKMRIFRIWNLNDAILRASGVHTGRWPRLLSMRLLLFGVVAVCLGFGLSDLLWIVRPEVTPELTKAYRKMTEDPQEYGLERQVARIEFSVPHPERWLFSLHSGLAWRPVSKERLIADPKRPTIGYIEVPAQTNGLPVDLQAILVREQRLLWWDLPHARPKNFLFPITLPQR